MATSGTGIVIGSHSLKVVQLRKKGGVPRLTRVANIKLDSSFAEHAFDAKKKERLRTLLAGAGVKPGESMVGLTGRDLIVRYTHVPPVPDWRLDMLMKFEIEEVSEQSGGEVSADWARLDIDETVSGENTILVALSKNASLLPKMELMKSAGLKVHGACPNSIAMFHSFVSTAKIPAGEVTLLMHVGAENTDIAIQKDGKLLFARNVSGGGGLFTEAVVQQFNVKYDRAEKMKIQKADVTPRSAARYEDSMAEKVSNAAIGVTGQFVSMVHSSVMFCKAQTKMKELAVDRVVLAGGGANLKGFADYLSQNLGIPVEIFDPLKAADLSALTPEEQEVVDGDGAGLAVAFGLAMLCVDRDAFSLEILPEEYRKRRNFVERDSWMIGAGAVVAVLIAILFYGSARDVGAATRDFGRLRATADQLRTRTAAFERAKTEYEALAAKWLALRDQLRVGPALQRAEVLVDRTIVGGGFDALSISRMDTDTVREALPGAKVPEGEDPPKILRVQVRFRAEIQDSGQQPRQVFSDFVRDLTAAAGAETGVSVEAGSLDGWSFSFVMTFDPPSGVVEPPAEEEPTDG